MNLDPTAPEERVTPRPFREEQAWQEIGVTEFSPGVRRILVIGFLCFIIIVPLIQLMIPRGLYARLAGWEAPEQPTRGTRITATVAAISEPPDTKGVYNDFLMQLHLTDVQGADAKELLVVTLGMRDRVVQPVAAIVPGSRVTLSISDWQAVSADLDGINGSSIEDDRFLTMAKTFGEGVAVAGQDSRPSGMDFLAVWQGRGSDLPAAHREDVIAGMRRAWAGGGSLLDRFLATNGHAAKRIKLYEDALDDGAVAALVLRPPVQGLLCALDVGNEKAYVGRDGWIFYAPGVQAVVGRPFLEPLQLWKRTRGKGPVPPSDDPDPRPAIIGFRDDLAKRGIELVLMPMPVKPSIHPERFSARMEGAEGIVRNRSFEAFIEDMREAGVRVYDPGPLLMKRKATGPQFLATDTHWTPAAMQAVAAELAASLKGELPAIDAPAWTTHEEAFTQFGDIATMLKLPDWQGSVTMETATVQAIRDAAGAGWTADPQADVLLLGDSFTNIYHLGPMGWGAHAGFPEHLSMDLGRPLDLIAQNDAGAKATRKLLAEALAEDGARLDGKKIVIWQFAERELAVGDWPVIPLPDARPAESKPLVAEKPPVAITDAATAREAFAALAAELDEAGAPATERLRDWLHLTSELRHLGRGPFWGEHAAEPDDDPVRAIVDLKDKLEAMGIRLILCPAPPRAVIYPDTVFDQVPRGEDGIPRRLDAVQQDLYAALREAGVTVVDVTDAFLAARADDGAEGPVCCPQDTHWSPRGLRIAAAAVAAEIGDPDWLREVEVGEFIDHDPVELHYVGDLVRRVEGHPPTERTATILRVTEDEAGETPLRFRESSPVLLLADSHGLVFSAGDDMHCTGAGFGEMLSLELGFAIDRIAQRGSGDTVRRELASRWIQDPGLADGKRVLIYTFAARTFTEFKSWKPVPLKP